MKAIVIISASLLLSVLALAQANGNLQMHFIKVGQGDAALLISPKGQTVLFDEGVASYCDFPVEYIESLGIKSIDYLVTSHYHDDHIGCTREILDAFPLKHIAYDRGGTYPSRAFDTYVKAVGPRRQTAASTTKITLDIGTGGEVIVAFLAVDGAGINTKNENDRSVVCLISFGQLEIMMGGDLSGYNISDYKDIESIVAKNARQVEVYKVHHHCSEYSSNSTWLDTISPRIGIIPVSRDFGRKYEHPAPECLERLHLKGIRTYWTDYGGGSEPDPAWDIVGGNIVVEAAPGSHGFTVRYNGTMVDKYQDWGYEPAAGSFQDTTYAWSRNSDKFHYQNCSIVKSISQENLQTGQQRPVGKTLHKGCPKL